MTMPHIDLALNGDNAWPDWADKPMQHFTAFRMTGLRDGMASGKPSFSIGVELEDGSVVILETSYTLLDNALRAFRARWGIA